MNEILDWVSLEDIVPTVMLICLLFFVGGQMTRGGVELESRARRLSAAAFLAYAGMGIYAWGAWSVTDLLAIVTRAGLAAGLAMGSAMIVLPPLAYLVHLANVPHVPQRSRQPAVRTEPTPRRVEADSTEQRAAAEKAERERKAKADDARAEVTAFYEKHQSLIEEALPPALFRSHLQTHFPDGIAPNKAWSAAQEMITGMLPLIAKAREKERADEEERQKQDAKAAAEALKRTELEERKDVILRLTQWYEKEKANIEQTLPDDDKRDAILSELFDRYDHLIKETLREMKP